MKKQNNRKNLIFVITAALFLIIVARLNAEVTIGAINAEVDKQQITIGDIIKYKVDIQLPQAAELKQPIERQEELGEFIVKDFEQKTKQGKQQDLSLEYKLTIFQTGQFSIPEYSVVFRNRSDEDWQTLSAKPVEITVKSLLEDDKEHVLKSLKPKIIVWQEIIWWILLAAIIAITLIALLFIFSRKKINRKPVEKLEPAHVIAYRELEKLQKLNLPHQGRMEEYFQKLSGCIRDYLENRFHLRAPWMSTEEFLQGLRSSTLLNTSQRKLLKDFLGLSDLVKFARYGSSPKEADDYFFIARNFIDQTREVSIEERRDV